MIQEARSQTIKDYCSVYRLQPSALDGEHQSPLVEGGKGATAYGDAVAVFLAFALDRSSDFNNSLTGWKAGNEKMMNLFSRQAIPMAWDFAEANIMENVVGGFITNVEYQTKCLNYLPSKNAGFSTQAEAQNQNISKDKLISTDPPYYDNKPVAIVRTFFKSGSSPLDLSTNKMPQEMPHEKYTGEIELSSRAVQESEKIYG